MRKHIGAGVALLATAALLAGCSSGTGGEAEPTEAAPIDGAGQTLTVWVDENRMPAVEAAAATFEEETGATVELVQKNFDDIRNDFIAQVPTGDGPDITVGAHDWLGALVAAGVVNTIDLGDTASQFEQVALDAMTYDGQLYALPYSLETIALIQNVDLVGEEAPATWDDMIQAGLDSGAERPFVINTAGQTGDGYTMYGFQTSFGAPVFVQDESGSYTSEVGMGGEAGEAFATWLGENGEKGTGYISTTVDYAINNELFATGKAPFTVQGPWAIADLTAQGVEVAVNPIPSAGGEDAAPFVGVQGFYLSSQSANTLLANEFLVNYIGTEDAQRALYEADPRIPAWSDLADEVASDPIIAGFLASSKTGVPMPSIPEMGSVWDYWNAAEVQIISGADPVSTWNTMIDELTAALEG
ncbi:arabinogalactan oligomer/maltooligosaccharide transport system substrate-binding protein [Microbacterium terrae]|uniref:Maltose-binding periplasmic protein n=1 Tax=Microbacterium terrae TaxID=69369 RepID=A0A0M2H484_9MICO|nr:extracellular solute-binding protein [Microbacterium terrae]KJL39231.1 Maltose-binding periplasmic protein precursor [Microbacterium terrae]MBP1076835.1 arabinogalactan oligomer/maltooligosaccharide transport system substrate-binding protein [Microbacterium terrae]GLJ99430.1 sugar ABC transporter substrate-binding protein [Microbacterium terrae]